MLSARFRAAVEAANVHDARELFREDVAFLEFATEVDGKRVEGVDKLTFDEDGRISELEVMIRPASALQAVAARMAEELEQVGLSLPGRG